MTGNGKHIGEWPDLSPKVKLGPQGETLVHCAWESKAAGQPVYKPASEFRHKSESPHGFASSCKACYIKRYGRHNRGLLDRRLPKTKKDERTDERKAPEIVPFFRIEEVFPRVGMGTFSKA